MLKINRKGWKRCNKAQFRVPEKAIEPKLKIVAFYEKGWSEDTSGIANLKKYYQHLEVLSPYWYTLTEGGEVITAKVGFEPEVEKFVTENKQLKLMPLINNAKTGDYTMFQNPRVRSEAVINITKLVQKHNYAGVNIDFQQIPPETKEGMTALITELHQELAPMQKLVAVSVLPKLDGLEDISAAYDYAALAKQADFITIMTYDKHSEQDNNGSIAPLNWVEKNIIEALKYIPREKLLLCVGGIKTTYFRPPEGYYTREIVDAVPLLIHALNEQGFKYVTISELLRENKGGNEHVSKEIRK